MTELEERIKRVSIAGLILGLASMTLIGAAVLSLLFGWFIPDDTWQYHETYIVVNPLWLDGSSGLSLSSWLVYKFRGQIAKFFRKI